MPSVSRLLSSPLHLLPAATLFSLLSLLPALAQQSGGVAPNGVQVRLIRATLGAKGEPRNGSFVMTEPRSTFYIPDDREVIVYFEWEGSKGTHHCEGSVHGPHDRFNRSSYHAVPFHTIRSPLN
jgi:hypothetical protein